MNELRERSRGQGSANNSGKMMSSGSKERESVNYEFGPKETNKVESSVGTGMLSFLSETDRKWIFYLTIISLVVRLAFLNHPSVVIFDEVHFGGFAQKYLTGEFFFDLHPPLARLLVTLSAWIGGFDGKFSFYDIGADYLKPAVPYVMMRAFCAVSGAFVAPIAYVTLRGMDISVVTAVAMATVLIFENALVTQSRLILLDAYLVVFTTLIAFFWVLFRRQSQRPFSEAWNGALYGLGISMALAASCKWVGLFAVAAVGLYTIVDLWRILGDVRLPLKDVGKHFMARAMALIVVPVAIYAATFWIHFALLTNFSGGAASMSLEFQQTLKGGQLPPTMAAVFYGSEVRIRQYRTEGVYLHSHHHLYPAGSKQQQITGYHHRDQNNFWIIRRQFKVNVTYEAEEIDEQSELVPLRHGDVLRLEHSFTGRFLHSHNVEPPVSNKEKQFEVSGYAHHPSQFSDLNDNWRIEIVDDKGNSITEDLDDEENGSPTDGGKKPPVLAIGTKFRLVQTLLGCSLHCRNKPLPEWGFKQAEITCGRETLKTNQIWMIESNTHPLGGEASVKVTMAGSGFWGKFIEMNRKMWQTNAGLSSEHPFGSRPDSWPILGRGVGFWNGNHVPKTEKQFQKHKKGENKEAKKAAAAREGVEEGSVESGDERADSEPEHTPEDEEETREQARLANEYIKFKGQQVYLLGNPIVWWSSTAAIAIYILTVMMARIAKRRGLAIATFFDEQRSVLGKQCDFMSSCGFLFIQWLWHFVPFFGMERQLFLHHYLPALYFAVLLFAVLLETFTDVATSKLSPQTGAKVKIAVLAMYTLATVYVFWRLAPLGYGLRMSKGQCESMKWLRRWDFDCNSLVEPVTSAIVTSK